jgi:hypothetical protein
MSNPASSSKSSYPTNRNSSFTINSQAITVAFVTPAGAMAAFRSNSSQKKQQLQCRQQFFQKQAQRQQELCQQ